MSPPLCIIFLCLVAMGCAIEKAEAQTLNQLVTRADSLRLGGNYIDAEQTYQQALFRSRKDHRPDSAGLICLRLGLVYERRTLYRKALDSFFESMNLFKEVDSKNNLAAAELNIGNIFRIIEKLEDAFRYSNSALQKWILLKDSVNIPYALRDLGNICTDQDHITKAVSYYRSVLVDYKSFISEDLRATILNNMAVCYVKNGDFSQAMNYYKRAYYLRSKDTAKYEMADVLCNMASLYISMRQYEKAINVQRKSIELAYELQNKQLLQWGYENFALIYEHMGEYKKAYAAATKGSSWKDSVYSEIKNEYKFSEAEYQREQERLKRERQEDKNKLLEKKIEQERWKLNIVILITVLILLSVYFFYKAYRTKQQNERILEKQRSIVLENHLKKSELTALRAQMNPHFIFNALSSIKNYMLEQNAQLADYYLGKFAKLIRLILDNSSENFVSLEKEVQLLESYVQLEQLRFENKFSYELHIDENIVPMETFIPSMIIQPFVENAIIHGFMHKEGNCHLCINIARSPGCLIVVIEDNGIGRIQSALLKSKTTNLHHQSKGYKISEQRLNVLSRNSSACAGIVFRDLDNAQGDTGTRVEISIPTEQSMIE